MRNSRGKTRVPGSKSLPEVLRCPDAEFLDFLQKCLEWDPEKRLTPEAARAHPWVVAEFAKRGKQLRNVETNEESRKNVSYRARPANVNGNATLDVNQSQGQEAATRKLNASLSGAAMNLSASFAGETGPRQIQPQTHRAALRNKLNILRERLGGPAGRNVLVAGAATGAGETEGSRKGIAKGKLFLHVMNRGVLPPLVREGGLPGCIVARTQHGREVLGGINTAANRSPAQGEAAN